MPFIDIYVAPNVMIGKLERPSETASLRVVARKFFGPSLPQLIVDKAKELALDDNTPADAVQVKHWDHGVDDINITDLSIIVQFSEVLDLTEKREYVRDRLVDITVSWFHDNDYKMPDEFSLDIKWGPMHGVLMINGQYIEY
jgi:hypothetical protein